MTSPSASAETAHAAGVSRWRQIHDRLAADIAEGRVEAGERLPSEQELARRFGVHRHTIRQALQALAADGRIRIAHGRGSFASAEPLRYALGARTSFTANVTDQGRSAGRRVEHIETLRATAHLAAQLELRRGAGVVRVTTVATADGVPLARGRHHFPLHRLRGIVQAIRATHGISAALARCGVRDVRRARTRISTRAATPEEADALAIAPRQPVLVTEGLDVDGDGRPVQYGVTAFAGGRVELDVAS